MGSFPDTHIDPMKFSFPSLYFPLFYGSSRHTNHSLTTLENKPLFFSEVDTTMREQHQIAKNF